MEPRRPTLLTDNWDEVTFQANQYDNPTVYTPPDCPGTPVPQASATPALANTGASLVVPGIVGLLALLTGIAALLVTRRRRTG